jgi:hypothetical protein
MSTALAPVALFVFNRPHHTRQAVESLLANRGSERTELFIFSDGPRAVADTDDVAEVRKYLRTIEGFLRTTIIERDRNVGLANSIIGGVTEVVNRFGRVIVMEDDLVTSPYFLRYMNDALERYQDEERVMHVSGYMFPIRPADLGETFFIKAMLCWGWGTWARAWNCYRRDADSVDRQFTAQMKREFNLDDANDFWGQVEANRSGRIDTWAIFWYASIFLKNGLCLNPTVSFVHNIGHDGSGTNCGDVGAIGEKLNHQPVADWPPSVVEDRVAAARLARYFKESSRLPIRVARKWRGLIDRLRRPWS